VFWEGKAKRKQLEILLLHLTGGKTGEKKRQGISTLGEGIQVPYFLGSEKTEDDREEKQNHRKQGSFTRGEIDPARSREKLRRKKKSRGDERFKKKKDVTSVTRIRKRCI